MRTNKGDMNFKHWLLLNENVETNFETTSLTPDQIKKNINVSLGGKAKIVHLPYGNVYAPNVWWTIVMFREEKKEWILNKLEIIKKKYNINMTISQGKDYLSKNELASRMIQYSGFDKYSLANTNSNVLIILISPKEEETNNTMTLYHTTFNKDLSSEGLRPQSNLKYKNRIYLYNNLEMAIHFARYSNKGNIQKKTAYIYEVVPTGKIYIDHEENDNMAAYTYSAIPPNNIKLVKILNF